MTSGIVADHSYTHNRGTKSLIEVCVFHGRRATSPPPPPHHPTTSPPPPNTFRPSPPPHYSGPAHLHILSQKTSPLNPFSHGLHWFVAPSRNYKGTFFRGVIYIYYIAIWNFYFSSFLKSLSLCLNCYQINPYHKMLPFLFIFITQGAVKAWIIENS